MRRIPGNILKTTLVALVCCVTASHAQRGPGETSSGYPNRPIRVLVGSPPGSGTDIIIRDLGQRLAARWGRPIVVDNRGGALGAVAIELAARAVPDGYTLVMMSGQTVTGMLLKTVNVDIQKSFAPIVPMSASPYLMVANPQLPANSVQELIALARSKPGKLVYASSGTGGIVHLGMELFKSMAGLDMLHVPYKGSGLAMVDLVSGQVQLAITNTLTAGPLVRGGRLKALAVTTLKRLPAFPDVPTVAESGVSGFELKNWDGLFAPAGTPQAIVLRINADVSQITNAAEMRGRLAAEGAEAAPPGSPAEFKQAVAGEIAKWDKFLRTSGLKLN